MILLINEMMAKTPIILYDLLEYCTLHCGVIMYEHVQSSHNNEEYTESPNEQCDQDEQNSKNGTIYKSVVLESMIILMGLISYKVLDNFNFLNKAHNKISYIGRCKERQSFRMVAMH